MIANVLQRLGGTKMVLLEPERASPLLGNVASFGEYLNTRQAEVDPCEWEKKSHLELHDPDSNDDIARKCNVLAFCFVLHLLPPSHGVCDIPCNGYIPIFNASIPQVCCGCKLELKARISNCPPDCLLVVKQGSFAVW